jgi:porin
MLLRESEKDTQGLGAFFRYGFRHEDTFRLNQFWSGGLAYTGPIPTRDKDTLGFAVGQMISSEDYKSMVNPQAGSETMYELYYAIQITPWLVLTPDIQYIDNPNGTEALSHATP